MLNLLTSAPSLAVMASGAMSGALAQEVGALDSSFGSGGYVQFDYNDTNSAISAMGIDPVSGRIIAGGSVSNADTDAVFLRLKPNGSIDTSYGVNGYRVINIGSLDTVVALALRPDGRAVGIAGFAANGVVPVAQLTANGALDAGFAGDGIAEINIGGLAYGTAIALHPTNGSIAIGATGYGGVEFRVARVTTGGALDTTFNAGGETPGVADVSPTANTDVLADVAVQTDGKIVAVGTANDTGFGSNVDFGIVRWNANGTPDSSFGTGGIALVDFDSKPNTPNAVVIQPDGKIVVAGTAVRAGETARGDFAVARLNTSGALDNTFSEDGRARVQFSGLAIATDVLVQPDGKIVLGGTQQESTVPNFALARLNANGTLDTTFVGQGHYAYPATQVVSFGGLPDRTDEAAAIVRQPDGKYVLAGSTSYADVDFALARFFGEQAPLGLKSQFTLVKGLQNATNVARLRDNGFGAISAEQRKTSDGTLVGNDAFFAPNGFTARQIVGLPNIGGSAAGDLAVLATQNSDGAIKAEIRDGDTGALIRQISVYGAGFLPVWLFETPDLDANGKADIGVLAQRVSDKRNFVKIVGSISGNGIGAAIQYAGGLTALRAEALPDLDVSGAPDIAVLAANYTTGRYLVEIRNASGAAAPRTINFLDGFDPVDFQLGPDTDGNSVPELAVLAVRRSNGRAKVEMRNAFGPAAGRDLYFSEGQLPIALGLAGDTDGNSVPEWIGLLGKNVDHRPATQLKNATGTVNNLTRLYHTSAFSGQAIFVLPDSDSLGGPDIGVIAERSTDGRVRMEIKNAREGGTERSFFFSP